MFPRITCDVCGEALNISKTRGGIVAWDENGDVRYAHKGVCSNRLHRHPFAYWDDLPIFLINLSVNTGCGLKELREAERHHAFLAGIGLAAWVEREEKKANATGTQKENQGDE